MNLYSYCHNNPINSWDPSGHWQQGDEKLPTAAQKAITQASNAYLAAQAKGDQVGMNTAHETADAVRQMCAAGVWGGSSSGGGGSSGSTSSSEIRAGQGVGAANAVWDARSDNQKLYLQNLAAEGNIWGKQQLKDLVCFVDGNGTYYSSEQVLRAQHPEWYASSSVVSFRSSSYIDQGTQDALNAINGYNPGKDGNLYSSAEVWSAKNPNRWSGKNPYSDFKSLSYSVNDKSVTIIEGSAGLSQVSFDNGLTLNAFGGQSNISASLGNQSLSLYGKVYGAEASFTKDFSIPYTKNKLIVDLTGDYASFGGGATFSLKNLKFKFGLHYGVGGDISLQIR